jgi:hypothetical protein
MAWPNVRKMNWKNRTPLRYRSGDEKIETLVVYSSTVTLDADSRRLIPGGTLLCEITSGTGDGKYGPYLKTATDGRQTISADPQVYVTLAGHDVTLGDLAVEGAWMGCVFDTSEVLEVNTITDTAGNRTTLKTAFPRSEFPAND